MNSAIELLKVSRQFGDVKAVDEISIDIVAGEFFAMLGPSGSGKTTCLRLIAGFERADQGRIKIFDKDVGDTPPYHREVNTVFQDYALFPHLSVLDNVAFGLMIKNVPKATRHKQAQAVLEMVRLPNYGDRRPAELSGGQRQRVALARALINKPKVLLLDEPLGALDLKLREQMQEELKDLQHQLQITFVFVTHDQTEALSMADRIAVFNEGRVVQVDSPKMIYEQPTSRFVADFVGSSNVLPPNVLASIGEPPSWASLRPERIKLVPAGGFPATVTGSSYLGGTTRLQLEMLGVSLVCILPSTDSVPQSGSMVNLSWDNGALHSMEDA